jgi:putative transposase
VIATVAEYYGVAPATFQERRRGDENRDVAAWVTRRLTTATLPEVAGLFNLSHPGSISNLLRRAEQAVADSNPLRRVIEVIEQRLMKTENEV